MNDIINDASDRMYKSLLLLQEQLIRLGFGGIGGAIDNIKVEYYGSLTPLIQVASITSPYRGKFVIRPHDHTLLKEIERAIHKADLGVSVTSDKLSVHAVAPSPTIQQREKMAEYAIHLGNDAKVAIRKIRQDARTKLKKVKLPKDEEKRGDVELQEFTYDFCCEIDEACEHRRDLILEG